MNGNGAVAERHRDLYPQPGPQEQSSVPPRVRRPTPADEYERNTGPLYSTGPLVPQGALQLLPQESVVYQLGALYLTNKRVILLAPTVVRSAFVRDIDAVGTLTERATGWNLFFGLLWLAAAGALVYADLSRQQLESTFALLYIVSPLIPAGVLALLALFVIVRYFLWRKRSLFVSVKGRPLITVSMTDWKSGKLAGMDSFVNAFFEIKDHMTGELGERPYERPTS